MEIKSVNRRLAAGTDSVAYDLDRIFRERLCRMVDLEMHQMFKRRQDPEDVVQSVMRTFFRRAANGDFEFGDQEAVWALLKHVARNKIRNRVAKDKAKKRDITLEEGIDDCVVSAPSTISAAQAHLLGNALELALAKSGSPTAELMRLQLFGFEIHEIVDIVLQDLEPPNPRILQLRLQGYSESKIGLMVGCGREAVRYRLKRIRSRLVHLIDQYQKGQKE